MDDKEVIMTQEGLQKLEQELDYLKSVRRHEVAERIKQAREFGDITENSEYEDAKNEQAFIEGRILTLENLLRNARLIDETDISSYEVSVGSTVQVRDLSTGEDVTYSIVGPTETNPLERRISHQSPVGRALLGHRVGDVVDVKVPAGTLHYQIVSITR